MWKYQRIQGEKWTFPQETLSMLYTWTSTHNSSTGKFSCCIWVTTCYNFIVITVTQEFLFGNNSSCWHLLWRNMGYHTSRFSFLDENFSFQYFDTPKHLSRYHERPTRASAAAFPGSFSETVLTRNIWVHSLQLLSASSRAVSLQKLWADLPYHTAFNSRYTQ